MDFILYDLSLTEITQDNLQICLEEGENYEGIIGFNHIDYYKLENVFVTARQLNEPDSPPIQDIASLKKLVLYLLCFLNKPVIDPNGIILSYISIHLHSISFLKYFPQLSL